MTTRIMMQAAGKQRPLSFEGSGENTLLLASTSTPWAGVQFEVHRTIPGEAREAGPIEGEHSVVVFLEGSVEMTVCRRSGEQTYRAVPGSTSFLAGDAPASTRVTGSAEVAAVQVSPEWFRRVDLPEAPAGFGRTPAPIPQGMSFPGAEANFADWAEINQCTGSPETLADHPACQTYTTCAEGAQTTLCTAQGGSHCGNYQSLGITQIAWEMFQKASLP